MQNNRYSRLHSGIVFEGKNQHADAYGRNSDPCAETAGTLRETEGSPFVLRKSERIAAVFTCSFCSVSDMFRLSFSSVCMIAGTLPTEISFLGKYRLVYSLLLLPVSMDFLFSKSNVCMDQETGEWSFLEYKEL